ncbi:MAG: protein kinase, partial [Myxococcota bacterium]|nr:protein kinase [Myxococcota bacterium]
MRRGLALGSMVALPATSGELAIGLSRDADAASAHWEIGARVGEGATSIVWRARHVETGRAVALKVAKKEQPGASGGLVREALLLARVARRWGPELLAAGPGFVATEWLEGEPIGESAVECRGGTAERLAATVAHAVGRGLEELHEAGVRHGDVKPANVLLSSALPRRDAADDRGATLIDLGMATSAGGELLGATPRYAAPELRERGESGPAADLWALGILLAELLDPRVAGAADPRAAMAAWGKAEGEPARWAQALVASVPGGRPSAAWLGSR